MSKPAENDEMDLFHALEIVGTRNIHALVRVLRTRTDRAVDLNSRQDFAWVRTRVRRAIRIVQRNDMTSEISELARYLKEWPPQAS